jgi:ABC-type branched-subunit amino acid transport system ATPase component
MNAYADDSVDRLLQVSDLTCRFGGLTAVDGLTFSVGRGHITSLIGPNGAGKTTVFNALTGLVRPTRGTVTLDETPIAGQPPHVVMARGVARTFQNIRLFDDMTVLENAMAGEHVRSTAGLIETVLRTRRQQEEEAKVIREALEALRFVDLKADLNQRAWTLAYGEKRRLEIARALASRPRLLLLDEPAAGMNLQETETLIMVIHRIRDAGVTVLLIEHQMRLVMGISDVVLVMDQGKLISSGPPAFVQTDPVVLEAYLGPDLDEGAA